MCESGWGEMPDISVLCLQQALKDMSPLLTQSNPGFRVLLCEGMGGSMPPVWFITHDVSGLQGEICLLPAHRCLHR